MSDKPEFTSYEQQLALDVLGVLDEYGWWGGDQHRNGNGQPKNADHIYCLGQAVVHVLEQRQNGRHVLESGDDFESIPFCGKLVRYLSATEGYDWETIPEWNDTTGRHYEEVQALLKEIATPVIQVDDHTDELIESVRKLIP